ncbi:Alcohol dehydrogenase [NADP(+)] A [Blattella germanica]|nr:Alcohol dehydrogenase [NADP(+)] A [Blattella germanica]
MYILQLQEDGELMPKTPDGKFVYSDVDYVDTWAELEKCVDQGLVRSLGLSNFNSKQLNRVLKIARIKPVNLQVECNPYLNQKKLINFCKKFDITVTGYSPLGSPDSPFLKPGTPRLLDF